MSPFVFAYYFYYVFKFHIVALYSYIRLNGYDAKSHKRIIYITKKEPTYKADSQSVPYEIIYRKCIMCSDCLYIILLTWIVDKS